MKNVGVGYVLVISLRVDFVRKPSRCLAAVMCITRSARKQQR